ncbi:hypothetical protein QBC34DRAFT_304179 [Podospora aff. communis PSN243]|uniref:Nucleoside-diphosphate-sugar epimerase n=1 Tax=Podospora aff. communis PSN243 TaxID=3040156 RepID=A0AAV9GGF8_9PEZI|nr:hypothetical protein QBC34DRAFT_304179 [Podospora aff. communis PSN243]
MHLILTGATGLVGTAVLDAMIKTPSINKISILSRRPVQMATDAKDPRINVIIHKDFTTYPPDLLEQIKDASGCVWALGISQNEVSKEDYVKITKDYTLSFADAFTSLPSRPATPFKFLYVSGLGATLTPGRFTPIFSRVKGETELALSEIRKKNPLFEAVSVRAGFIDWFGHESIKQYMPAQGVVKTVMGVGFAGMVRAGWSSVWNPTEPLGKFLTGVVRGEYEGKLKGKDVEVLESGMPLVESAAVRRLIGLDK